MLRNQTPIPTTAERGFTLIEVLVSIVIVAFGLLGVAGLLIKSASLGVSAHNRTLAIQNVYQMVDRMRLSFNSNNYTETADYSKNDYLKALAAKTGDPGGSFPDCASGCTITNDVVDHDYGQWWQDLKASLGSAATGEVTLNKTTNLFTITVTWQEKNFGLSDFNTQSYALDIRP